jgi:hypothetical protein
VIESGRGFSTAFLRLGIAFSAIKRRSCRELPVERVGDALYVPGRHDPSILL